MTARLPLVLGVIVLGLLACLLLAARWQRHQPAAAAPPSKLTLGPEDLFVTVPSAKDLLEAWRWKVGKDATVFRVTVWGDLFTRNGDGRIYWLDTGGDRYVEVARSVEQWASAANTHGMEWFHGNTLLALRARGLKPAPGQVYSWRQPPYLGGAETVDNVDLIDLEVHVSNAGRLAAAVKDVPPGAKIEDVDFQPLGPVGSPDSKVWDVVINAELQYSMWPGGTDLPAGWKRVGMKGTKEECLDYIKTHWTDMRPLSQRDPKEGQQP
ncbi:MAG TPA: MbtH family NRPS accessory protein [Thermoanaerobaculia bacterium]|nr:MbtH family NRPS accessory protein [Thermoanaerobaculia bacterium]